MSMPHVMGIINVTPDSFYDGGNTTSIRPIIAQATKMLGEGATFLDIGGYSSRPNASDISASEEIERVIPAIKAIIDEFPEALISIDTFRSNVASAAIEAGACIVNDISGGLLDAEMYNTVARYQVPYILMHMRGTPQTMKTETDYKNITKEVLFYFSQRIAEARSHNINDIIVDPGFGFSKTAAQSFELMNSLELFKHLDLPILAGVSRKSMIYKTLKTEPTEALNGTTALNMVALQKGASILRVHDVKEAMECIKLNHQLNKHQL
ncbi:dihydropteroate synthase [Patiriisocius marinistellae]|uniref:Dihydropteroate synthase n=2 Tax=Patiriisocius marinistellae TaxID=2494560 RepID=A0A5J4FWN3_9FLAO|nr:dihydropteroate synthase [Patiriisocius marinistellae]